LANYVAVPFPASASSPHTATAPASGSISPLSSPPHGHPVHINSFWSETSSGAGDVNGMADVEPGRGREPEWTTEIPLELIAAAGEEEAYLASTDSHEVESTSSASAFGGIPAPNIPPAPVLPRHLDKLILNVRPATVSGSPGPGDRERSKRSGKERSRRERERERDRDRESRSRLGMTSSTAAELAAEGELSAPAPSPLGLPVVTASGTEVTAGMGALASPLPEGTGKTTGAVAKLDFAGMADDNSVLPVPSHVVLHHLSTSAIKNGVLAVANTTRYKKKYITTIYYKPT